ncbi:MAG: helix-turn-helix domain-containing protein [Chitinophagales bacterium]
MIVMDNIMLNKASNITNTAADKLRRLFGKDVEVRFIIKDQFIEIQQNDSSVVDTIVTTVCNYFNIKEEELKGKSRVGQLSDPRSMCYNLIHEYVRPVPSLSSIAQMFSRRDHSTIIHALRKFRNMYDTENLFRKQYHDITQIIDFKLNNKRLQNDTDSKNG